MSKEAARAFHERLKTDETLASTITAHGADLRVEDMVQIAQDAGFACSADDLDAVGREAASELDDAALDAVAGGAGPTGQGVSPPALNPRPGVQILDNTVMGVRNIQLAAYKTNSKPR